METIVKLRNKYCHQSQTVQWNDLVSNLKALHTFMTIITDKSDPMTVKCLMAVQHLINWIQSFDNKPPSSFIVLVSSSSTTSLGPCVVFKQEMDNLVFIGRDECYKTVVSALTDVPQNGSTRYIALHGENKTFFYMFSM